MAKKPKKPAPDKQVEALRYQREDATRKNIPTVELQSVLEKAAQDPVRVAYEREKVHARDRCRSWRAWPSVRAYAARCDRLMKVFRVV